MSFMGKGLLLLLPLLLVGCKSNPFATFTFRGWAEQRLAETTEFPTFYSRKVSMGGGVRHPFTLQIYSPTSIWLNCGNGLVLKLREAYYQNDWAELVLEDTNGDNIKDLRFTALARDTPKPLKAIFVYQSDKWEHYLLPDSF